MNAEQKAQEVVENLNKAIKKTSELDFSTNMILGEIVFDFFANNDKPLTKEDLLMALDINISEYGEGTIKYECSKAVIERLRSSHDK